jgi:hypothetical protein
MPSSAHRARTAAALGLACAGLALGACSSDSDEELPTACLADSDAYVAALATAPDQVRLQGETPISDCLLPDQEGGQLATVGQQMVAAATDLNVAAQDDPEGPEAIWLGYLVGAIERGAEGIHADLVRRVNSAARFSADGLLPASFERTFGEGYAAGLESG